MERLGVRVPSVVAFAAVLAVDVLYVVLIRSQGGPPEGYLPFFVAGYLALMAALIAIALVPRPEVAAIRVPLRAASAAGLLVLGFLAAFSIGTPILIAGFLVVVALAQTQGLRGSKVAVWSGVVAAMLAVAVLIAGFEITNRLIVCPETGTTSGGGSGLVTGPYHYECVEGGLHFHSGS
jgi:hypothetical protein